MMAMPSEKLPNTDLALLLLSLFPPSIRVSTLDDEGFRERFGFFTEAVVNLGLDGASFVRSELFGAVRNVLGDKLSEGSVTAKNGLQWMLLISGSEAVIVRAVDGAKISLPDFSCLAPDRATRIAWFDHQTEQFELKDAQSIKWRGILDERSLADEEVDFLLSEIRLTPLYVAGSIASHLRSKTINVSSLVPSDIRYYERLVGEQSDQVDVESFIATSATSVIRSMIEKEPLEGLKRAMLLSAHPSFAQIVPLSEIQPQIVEQCFEWLVEKGDRISQLGGIECGLAHLNLLPELEQYLVKIVQCFLTDDPDDPSDRLNLLCSVVVLVDGELARTGIARGKPPFWRRLAAITHASTIERKIVAASGKPATFNKWAMQSRGRLYYMRSFLDLRIEPRWLPDFILPDQLKAEFIGRIATAAHVNKSKVKTVELADLLFGNGGGVQAQVKFPHSCLPGPLEGGSPAIVDMPLDRESAFRKDLEADPLTSKSFAALVNSAFIFRIGPQLAQLSAHALRRAKYQLRRDRDRSESFALLIGLASVAAVTRSSELAGEVRILVRAVRRADRDLEPENELRIALTAAAAHSENAEWCEFVGDWLSELAFEDMTHEGALILAQHIQVLCALESNLWETCSKAESACMSFAASTAA
jgi:hypothetical protein